MNKVSRATKREGWRKDERRKVGDERSMERSEIRLI